ncbi:mitochondrial carrier domain-containing protein [Dipodascopsis tothii]|uniref:mitochondrial carrier domain-containing protein n=1 Tax=Dipodascopsis tothii TaxID=44089 RepID=UPI0034CEE423
MSLSKEQLPPWGSALSGAAGAIVANTMVYPLDLVKTKLQIQPKRKPGDAEKALDDAEDYYETSLDAIDKIYRKKGVRALYSGLPGSLLGVASTNFAYFYWYGWLRSSYQNKYPSISTAAELVLGALAGALAQMFTIPVSVITTRQQSADDKVSFRDTAKEILAEDGVSGLWKGLKASLVLVVNPAITYGMYQRFKVLIYKDKPQLTALDSFFLGALSKSMATVCTQPLIVAKVMLQSKPRAGQRHYSSFVEALRHLVHHEGPASLFKGIGPQISKGVLVQGLLFMFRDQIELLVMLLIRLVRQSRRRAAVLK